MHTITARKRGLASFFVILILLSIPFWIVGALTKDTDFLPAGLPVGALMAVCPMLAALVLVARRDNFQGVRRFLRSMWTLPKNARWYAVALLYMPVIMIVCFAILNILGLPLPSSPQIFWVDVPFLLFLFLLGAIGEEVGWTGYILSPLQKKYGVIIAAIILACIGAFLHAIPLLQGDNTLSWILWQCCVVFLTRLITVWLYFASGKSMIAVILFHMMDNVSFALFPNGGSHYDPFIKMIVLVVVFALTLGLLQLRSKRRLML